MPESTDSSAAARWGLVAAVGGLAWALSPATVMVVDARLANAVYLLPLVLFFGVLYALGREIADTALSLIGYLITGLGFVVLAVGALIEAIFPVATLATRGIAQGQVFYVGLFAVLLGALFLGGGLWRARERSYAGAALALVVPVSVAGFWLFHRMGWGSVNWIPVTVPYGAAWMLLGITIWREYTAGADGG